MLAADAADSAGMAHEDSPLLESPTRPYNAVQTKFDWIFFLNGLLGMKAFLSITCQNPGGLIKN